MNAMELRIQQRALARDPANKVSLEFPRTSAAIAQHIHVNTTLISIDNMAKPPKKQTFSLRIYIYFSYPQQYNTSFDLLFSITLLISSAIRLLATDKSSYFPSPLEDVFSSPFPSPACNVLLGYKK